MRKVRMTQEERINAKVIAMRAHRRSVQRKKAIPAIVTAVCALAFLAGGSALGISLINNTKPAEKPQTVQATVPAKNAQNTQNTAKTMNVNTNNANTNYAQDTMPTYDESTNSYSYSFNGYENNDYSNDENFSRSENSYSVNNTDSSDNGTAAVQPAYTGTHHSGANWNGTGSPLHFYENGKIDRNSSQQFENFT